ncbi:MAG: hypothetical protein KJ831_12710, partial [Candidatus Eisenbacteria bacterium]|nr:hypothetical protein [Candidatus Eisenbacteria bacterium]
SLWRRTARQGSQNSLVGPFEIGYHHRGSCEGAGRGKGALNFLIRLVDWNGLNDAGRKVPGGVYFYNLTAPGIKESRRMILLP